MLLTMMALAQAGAYEGDLRFTELERERGAIEWRLEARSYRALRVNGVTPVMAVWQDGELLWSEPMVGYEGSIRPPEGMNRRDVQVTVVGFGGNWFVRSIEGQPSVLLEARAPRDGRAHGPDCTCGGHDHAGHSAHSRHERPREVDAQRMSEALEACDDAIWDDRYQLSCAQAAVSGKGDPERIVEACDEAFWDDRMVLSCVEAAGPARRSPVAAIEACGDAFWDESTTLQCVQSAASATHEMATVIATCDATTWDESEALECVSWGARG